MGRKTELHGAWFFVIPVVLLVAFNALASRGLQAIQPRQELGVAALYPGHACVDAVLGHEVGVIALLGDPPLLEHQDAIRRPQRGDAMRDQHRRSGALPEVLEDPYLGLRVHRREGVVEQEDRCVSRTSARARVSRCFCPPESMTPRSPTGVSRPSGRPRQRSRLRSAASAAPSRPARRGRSGSS